MGHAIDLECSYIYTCRLRDVLCHTPETLVNLDNLKLIYARGLLASIEARSSPNFSQVDVYYKVGPILESELVYIRNSNECRRRKRAASKNCMKRVRLFSKSLEAFGR